MLSQLIASMLMIVSAPPSDDLKELLPGIRVGEKVIEFDGRVAINCHHPDTPDVFLEMLVTAPDSREHESLIVSKVKASVLHAALLAAGFESGSPISKDEHGNTVPASGDRVRVLVSQVDDSDPSDPDTYVAIESWAVHLESSLSLSEAAGWPGLVFAGSILGSDGYAADRSGTLISLTSFGDEVVAPTWTVSSEATIDEPVWIANRDLVPIQGTRVRVRIEAFPEELVPCLHQPDRIDIDRDP